MGWNQISIANRESQNADPILRGVPDGAFLYFVHSYTGEPEAEDLVSAWTPYGKRFPSVIWNRANVWATQFHPEKSQRWGLRILKNFLKECSPRPSTARAIGVA